MNAALSIIDIEKMTDARQLIDYVSPPIPQKAIIGEIVHHVLTSKLPSRPATNSTKSHPT